MDRATDPHDVADPAAAGPLGGTPVLVTGGTGFIGSHLVDALLAAGARVRVLDSFATGKRDNLTAAGDRVELVEGDIRDPEACRAGCRGVEVVFHQAALGSVPLSLDDPAGSLEVNVAGTARVLAAARDAGVGRVVYASSSSVYGDSEALPKVEGEEGRPLSPYALSKRMDEQLAEVFGDCFGLRLVGLRYFNVYGPRQDPAGAYAAVIPRFFRACLAGEAPLVNGDGLQSRDFTYVADAVAANLLAATAPEAACGRAYNVARGRRTTVLELAEQIRRLAGSDPPPEHGPERPGDVRHSVASIAAAREALGFAPRVDLEEGLARSLEHYRRVVGYAEDGSLSSRMPASGR
jgi:nucleoside-diphosphate-sugar epimerase